MARRAGAVRGLRQIGRNHLRHHTDETHSALGRGTRATVCALSADKLKQILIRRLPLARKRGKPSWHRMAGRILVPTGLLAALSGSRNDRCSDHSLAD